MKIDFVFFGSSEFSVFVLNELERQNLLPSLIITTPDKPKGRGLELSETPVKIWAQKRNIECLSPIKLSDPDIIWKLTADSWNLFLVASYGKIIPEKIFNIPPHKTLNIHPSLLPELRGASPVQTAILKDMQETGVSIMQIDAQMDHGPIITQEKIKIEPWPIDALSLKEKLATAGAKLFAKILPEYISGKIEPLIQDESQATFTKKIEKIDGQIELSGNSRENLLKTKAYSIWPNTYFFYEQNGKKIRIIVKDAEIIDGVFTPTRVVPEGKKEMKYEDFLRGIKK